MNNINFIKSNTLITGGMGYVGSFTCYKYFKQFKEKLLSIDNNSRSNKSSKKFCNNFKVDISNEKKVRKIILENNVKNIIHLASYTCVRESLKKSNFYKKNNLIKQKKFINTAKKSGVKKFIFSSSMSVYEKNKIKSNLSPYSKFKLEIEKFLIKKSDKNFQVIILRYPNISGAQKNGLLGDRNHKITRIFKTIFKTIIKNKILIIYANLKKKIYPMRNYAHVEDIAKINLKYLNKKKIFKKKNFELFNVTTNLNLSNQEILSGMEKLMKKNARILLKQVDKRENFYPFSKNDKKVKNIKIISNESTLNNILISNLKWFKKIFKEI